MRRTPKLVAFLLAAIVIAPYAHAEAPFYRRNITVMRVYDPAIDVALPSDPNSPTNPTNPTDPNNPTNPTTPTTPTTPPTPINPGGNDPFDINVVASTSIRTGNSKTIAVDVPSLTVGERIGFDRPPSAPSAPSGNSFAFSRDASKGYGYRLFRYTAGSSSTVFDDTIRAEVIRADGSVKGYRAFLVKTVPPLALTAPTHGKTRLGSNMTFTPAAQNAIGNLAWSTATTLPPWINQSSTTGAITVSAGAVQDEVSYVVKATDSDDASVASSPSIKFGVYPLLNANVPQNVYFKRVGQALAITPSLVGRMDAAANMVSWTASPALKTGIGTLNATTGTITVNTTAAIRQDDVKLVAKDLVDGMTDDTAVFDIGVFAPFTMTVPQTAYSVLVGQPITITPNAQNAMGAVQWTTTPTLPTWLSMNGTTGVITATTTARNYLPNLVLTATDLTDASVVNRSISIAVNLPTTATNFSDQNNIYTGAVVDSNQISYSGFYGTRGITVTGGTLLVNGEVRPSTSTIEEIDKVAIRMTASLLQDTSSTATVTVDGLARSWKVTTRKITAGDFINSTEVKSGSTVTSNEIVFDGFAGRRTVTAAGATLVVNGVASGTSASILTTDKVALRIVTSNSQQGDATGTATLEGIARAWNVKNRVIVAGTFTDQTGIKSGATVTSNTILFEGFAGTRTATAVDAILVVNGTERGASYAVDENDTVALRIATSNSQNAKATGTVTLDGIPRAWSVTNRAIVAGAFTPVTDAKSGATVTSNTILFEGFAGTRTATAADAILVVNGVESGTSYAVDENDTVALRITTSNSQGASVTGTATLDGIPRVWTIKNRTITAGNFTAVTDARSGATITSNEIVFDGFAGTRTLTATGGTLVVNGADAGTSFAADENDKIALRITMPVSQQGTATGTATLDGIARVWTLKNRAITAGTFSNQTGVNSGATVTSNTIVFDGFGGTRTATATGGTLVVNGVDRGASFAVDDDDTIALRITTSNSQNATATGTVTLDGIARAWSVQTRTITAGNFTNLTGTLAGQTITSSPITFSGFSGTRSITVTGATLMVNGATRPATSTVDEDDVVTMVLTTSTSIQATTSWASVNVDGVDRAWSVQTRAMTAGNFANLTGTLSGQTVTSSAITFTGFSGTRNISVSGATLLVNGAARPATSTIYETDLVTLSLTASTSIQATTSTASVTVDGVNRAWTVTTRAMTAGNFNANGGLVPNTEVTSNAITFDGFAGTRSLSASGARLFVNGVERGSPFNISQTDQVQLRTTASGTPGANKTASVTLDGISRNWTVSARTFTQVALSISPASHSGMFADGESGRAYSDVRTFTVTNTGEDVLNVQAVSFTNPGNFYHNGGTCGQVWMGQNQSCTVEVRAYADGTAGNSGFSSTITLSGVAAYNGGAKSVAASVFGDSLFPVYLGNGGPYNIQSHPVLTANGRWQANRPKRVILPAGVVLGSTDAGQAALRTGNAYNGSLTVTVMPGAEIQGAGGWYNAGGGGPAFLADHYVTLINHGAIRGGGGGGGSGGSGGTGVWWSGRNVTTTEGPIYNSRYVWFEMNHGGTPISLVWNGVAVSQGQDGWIYSRGLTMGSEYNNEWRDTWYQISRSRTQTVYDVPNYVGGAGGGTGGRGAGYAIGGPAGATGGGNNGGNSGVGGNGGNGGWWGQWGAGGASGACGNAACGSGGQGGGPPGASILNGHLVNYGGGGERNN